MPKLANDADEGRGLFLVEAPKEGADLLQGVPAGARQARGAALDDRERDDAHIRLIGRCAGSVRAESCFGAAKRRG